MPLEEFFKMLMFGCKLELRNRYLRVGQEHGTKTAEAVGELHRRDVGMNDVINRRDDVINDAINFSEAEKVAIKAILRDPKLSAARLADILGVKQRQDYQSVYIDLYDEFRDREKAEKESITDDIEFEMELVRQVEIPGETLGRIEI